YYINCVPFFISSFKALAIFLSINFMSVIPPEVDKLKLPKLYFRIKKPSRVSTLRIRNKGMFTTLTNHKPFLTVISWFSSLYLNILYLYIGAIIPPTIITINASVIFIVHNQNNTLELMNCSSILSIILTIDKIKINRITVIIELIRITVLPDLSI